MQHLMRPMVRAAAAGLIVVAAACSNTSDPRIIDAAESLVPPESEVTESGENLGLTFESGPYFVALTIDDGGQGPGLLTAIERQAEVAGWEVASRDESIGGVQLGYLRDDLEASVTVHTEDDVVTASIFVGKADD
jgi:hypothetical protein